MRGCTVSSSAPRHTYHESRQVRPSLTLFNEHQLFLQQSKTLLEILYEECGGNATFVSLKLVASTAVQWLSAVGAGKEGALVAR